MLLICGNNENEEALYGDLLKSDASKSRGKEPLIVDYRKLYVGRCFHGSSTRSYSIPKCVP